MVAGLPLDLMGLPGEALVNRSTAPPAVPPGPPSLPGAFCGDGLLCVKPWWHSITVVAYLGQSYDATRHCNVMPTLSTNDTMKHVHMYGVFSRIYPNFYILK